MELSCICVGHGSDQRTMRPAAGAKNILVIILSRTPRTVGGARARIELCQCVVWVGCGWKGLVGFSAPVTHGTDFAVRVPLSELASLSPAAD